MAFCDFCTCGNCEHGAPWLSHAPTADGRWICDICYRYDVCTSTGPCENEDGSIIECEHRPKLVGEWVKLTPEELADLEARGINHYAD